CCGGTCALVRGGKPGSRCPGAGPATPHVPAIGVMHGRARPHEPTSQDSPDPYYHISVGLYTLQLPVAQRDQWRSNDRRSALTPGCTRSTACQELLERTKINEVLRTGTTLCARSFMRSEFKTLRHP